jgi:spermidine synthase
VLGDARLSLVKAKPRDFNLMIFDAFSSDAIPVHLLTQEALALYLEKLADDGVLAFHITNRRLDLQPVLANLATGAGLVAWIQEHKATAEMRDKLYTRSSTWVVMARNLANLGTIASDPRWRRLEPREDLRTWTDDYSNILSAMRWTWPSFGRSP